MCQMVTIDVRVDTINKEMRRLIMVIAFITSLGEIMLCFHLKPCRFALFIHTATCRIHMFDLTHSYVRHESDIRIMV